MRHQGGGGLFSVMLIVQTFETLSDVWSSTYHLILTAGRHLNGVEFTLQPDNSHKHEELSMGTRRACSATDDRMTGAPQMPDPIRMVKTFHRIILKHYCTGLCCVHKVFDI